MDPHLQKLKLAYLHLGLYYGVTIPDKALVMYAEDLRHLPLERVLATMENLRRRRQRMPLPGDILDALDPQQGSAEAQANEVAGRIWQAIGRDGYTNPERAKERVGELGWYVVELMGGWRALCNSASAEQRGTLYAQCRALAKAHLESGPSGQPALPAPQANALPA